jgi:hypothetical protein
LVKAPATAAVQHPSQSVSRSVAQAEDDRLPWRARRPSARLAHRASDKSDGQTSPPTWNPPALLRPTAFSKLCWFCQGCTEDAAAAAAPRSTASLCLPAPELSGAMLPGSLSVCLFVRSRVCRSHGSRPPPLLCPLFPPARPGQTSIRTDEPNCQLDIHSQSFSHSVRQTDRRTDGNKYGTRTGKWTHG